MRKIFAIILMLFASIVFLSADKYWYKSQFNTGVYGNCGPTCVAMLTYYSTNRDVTVEEVRDYIGPTGELMGDGKTRDGATSFENLERALKHYHVPFVDVDYGNVHASQIDMFLNQGLKILILVNLDTISLRANRGMGYGGHYFIISGKDEKGNYEIQDPFNGSDIKFPRYVVTNAMISTEMILVWQTHDWANYHVPIFSTIRNR